jgi:hypothetical protein
MKAEKILFLVGLDYNGDPEKEEEFNTWYSERHVPIQLKARGIKTAARCKRTDAGNAPASYPPLEEYPNYLAVYEFENREAFSEFRNSPIFAELDKDLVDKWGKERPYKRKWWVVYEVFKTWKK